MNVLEMLLALRKLGVKFDLRVYVDAIKGILDHQDKNSNSSLPKFNFWNQVPILTADNITAYKASPANIVAPLLFLTISFNLLVNP
jgi:hypothetical protein